MYEKIFRTYDCPYELFRRTYVKNFVRCHLWLTPQKLLHISECWKISFFFSGKIILNAYKYQFIHEFMCICYWFKLVHGRKTLEINPKNRLKDDQIRSGELLSLTTHTNNTLQYSMMSMPCVHIWIYSSWTEFYGILMLMHTHRLPKKWCIIFIG